MSSKTKTTTPKADGKPALTPKLRFPAFRDATGWEERPIGDSLDLLSGYPFDGPDISQDNVGIRLLRGINITEGSIRHSTEIDRYYLGSRDGLDKFEVRANDLVIGMDGSKVGKNSALVTKDDAGALLIQRVARLRTDDPTLIRFIFLHVNSPLFHRYVDRINTSSGIPHISAKQIRDFAIYFPAPAEQQKIAACLGSLDELIAAQARKLGALKTHKKGLMQQLFPREGETQPRLRFPEFQNAGEWGVTSIGLLGEVVTGSTPSTARPEYYGGDRLFVSPADISDGRFIEKTKTTLTALGFEETRPIKANSILFVCIGSTIGKIAQNRHECATNQQINSVVPNSNNTHGFVYYALSEMADEIANLAGIQAVPIVNKSLFSSVELLVPEPPEQQRIADCLTSLDDLIAAQTQKLDALKTHKKGLMQQLFPSPEEVEA